MSIQFIIGSAGSGKSTYLRSLLLKEAEAHQNNRYLYVVPEQFTLQTQRELVASSGRGGILNIDVQSFARLALRVFEETGTSTGEILTETGKNLLLRKSAQQCRDNLAVLGNRLDRPGVISEIKSVISEFEQYEIDDEKLERMIGACEGRKNLQAKLRDLKIIRKTFNDYREDKFIMAEEVMKVFCMAAEKSQLLRSSIIVFDGFTGFTPVQISALSRIIRLCGKCLFAVTADAGTVIGGRIREHELFAMSKKMIASILRIAQDEGVEVLDPVRIHTDRRRHEKGSQLDTLEQYLFRYKKNRDMPAEGQITLHSLPSPSKEAAFAARMIRQLHSSGVKYREIAVITGDPESYRYHLIREFSQARIPYFLDETVRITQNPCLEFLRALPAVVEERFSYESVMRLLRTGACNFTREEIDLTENYILARGIRGRSRYEKPWEMSAPMISEEQREICENVRSSLMEKLAPFLKVFEKSRALASAYTEALYRAMESFGLEDYLAQREDELILEGDEALARQYHQVYGRVLDLLDEIYGLLGDEELGRKEFSQILEAGFSEAKVGIAPPLLEQVHVGDMQRTRLSGIKALIFLGINDGLIPPRGKSGGILSVLDRTFLEEGVARLAPGPRENAFIQRFYLYTLLTMPSQRLILCASRSANDGKMLHPSYLMTEISSILGISVIAQDPSPEDPSGILSPADALLAFAGRMRRVREGEPAGPVEKQLLTAFPEDEDYRRKIDGILSSFGERNGDKPLSPGTALALYSPEIRGSITRMELFAGCPFAHFARYGLGLVQRPVFRVQGMDLGTIFHEALLRIAVAMEKRGGSWADLTDRERKEICRKTTAETMDSYGQGLFKDTARNAYLTERVCRILERSVWALGEQLRAGDFTPSLLEYPFEYTRILGQTSVGGPVGPGAGAAPSGAVTRSLRLKGRIDRIDIFRDEKQALVKVIDYKSGNETLDRSRIIHGLSLQLPVYLRAAMEIGSRQNPGREIIPAGLFYYHIDDPTAVFEGTPDEDEIRRKLLKELRIKGLFNADEKVITHLDRWTAGESLVLQASRKKGGELGAGKYASDSEGLKMLGAYAASKLDELAFRAAAGEIKASPSRLKKKVPCTYCDYRDVCGFDVRLPGCRYHELRTFSDEEFWRFVRQETGDGSVSPSVEARREGAEEAGETAKGSAKGSAKEEPKEAAGERVNGKEAENR